MESNKVVQYVVDKDGRPSAVQISIETWEAILDKLEDFEDVEFIKSNLHRLREGPAKGQAFAWDEIKQEWDGKLFGETINQKSNNII